MCAMPSFLLSKVVEFGGNRYCGDKVLEVFLCSVLWDIGNFFALGGRSCDRGRGVPSFLLPKVMEFGGNRYCGDKLPELLICSELWSIESFCASGESGGNPAAVRGG